VSSGKYLLTPWRRILPPSSESNYTYICIYNRIFLDDLIKDETGFFYTTEDWENETHLTVSTKGLKR
jgi:hypothetical protein